MYYKLFMCYTLLIPWLCITAATLAFSADKVVSRLQITSAPRKEWKYDPQLGVAFTADKNWLSQHVLVNVRVNPNNRWHGYGSNYYFNDLLSTHTFRNRHARCPEIASIVLDAAKDVGGQRTRPSLRIVELFSSGVAVGKLRRLDAQGNNISINKIRVSASRLTIFFDDWVVSAHWILIVGTVSWSIMGFTLAARTVRGISRLLRSRKGGCPNCGYPMAGTRGNCSECGFEFAKCSK